MMMVKYLFSFHDTCMIVNYNMSSKDKSKEELQSCRCCQTVAVIMTVTVCARGIIAKMTSDCRSEDDREEWSASRSRLDLSSLCPSFAEGLSARTVHEKEIDGRVVP